LTLEQLAQHAPIRFAPRRLCHANLFVSDLDASENFYTNVCGLNVVFREPGISAVFFSNGNSHHDLAIEQVQHEARIGRDGQVQVPEGWAVSARLNHLGWEMATEAEIVAAYKRALEASLPLHRTADHQISRSVYLWDAEKNYLEIYVDDARDWRDIFDEVGDELLTGNWEPLATPPDAEPRYAANPRIDFVDGALAQPLRVGRATVVVDDLNLQTDYYRDVIGLRVLAHLADMYTIFGGGQGRVDLSLVQNDGSLPRGLHHFSMELADNAAVEEAKGRMLAAGIPIVAEVVNSAKTSIVVDDPDGMHVELFAPSANPILMGPPTGDNWVYHF
jgi:catechol 2,3-dioxygenase